MCYELCILIEKEGIIQQNYLTKSINLWLGAKDSKMNEIDLLHNTVSKVLSIVQKRPMFSSCFYWDSDSLKSDV